MRTIQSLLSNKKVSLSLLAILTIGLFFSCKKSDEVSLPPAPAFSYKQKNISLAEDIAMTPVKPDNTGGTVDGFTVSPNLPKGIVINSANGELSGTPSDTLLPTKYIVTAKGAGGIANDTITLSVGTVAFNYGNTGLFTLEINSTDLVTTPVSPVILAGTFNQFFVSPSPDSLTIKTGLKFNAQTGQISGTPNKLTSTTEEPTPATFTITGITTANKATSSTVSIIVNDKKPNFYYNFGGSFSVGTSISNLLSPAKYTTSGNIVKYRMAPNSPALPAGLVLDSLTGKITGTPTEAVNTTLIVRGINTGGYQDVNVPMDVEATAVAPQIEYAMSWISGDILDTLSRIRSGSTIYVTKPDVAVPGSTPFIYLNPITTAGQLGTFSIAPAFLGGSANEALSLTSSTGTISGTPGQFTASSNTTHTLTINNAAVGGPTGSFTVNLVSNAPFFTYNSTGIRSTLNNIYCFIQGQAVDATTGDYPGYATQTVPVGGAGVVSYTIYPNTSTTPAFSSTGLTFNTTTGTISGTPTTSTFSNTLYSSWDYIIQGKKADGSFTIYKIRIKIFKNLSDWDNGALYP